MVTKKVTVYKTISVPEDIKNKLEKEKDDRDWGTFLEELYDTARRIKKKRLSIKHLLEESYEVLNMDEETILEYCRLYNMLKEHGLKTENYAKTCFLIIGHGMCSVACEPRPVKGGKKSPPVCEELGFLEYH